jgi:hypothetical protein
LNSDRIPRKAFTHQHNKKEVKPTMTHLCYSQLLSDQNFIYVGIRNATMLVGYITLSSAQRGCKAAPVPVSTTATEADVKAASVPERRPNLTAKGLGQRVRMLRERCAYKTGRAISGGKKVSHVEGELECNIQES